jgi:hypothetical protein
MAGESKADKAEQRAFSNAVVSVMFAILGTGLAAALVYLATPIFEMLPSWLRYILVASGAVGIVYFLWLLVRLGGAAAGSDHRTWYVAFRDGITSDQEAGHYARGVTRAIAWSDRFLGDEGNEDKGIFPRAFGLVEAAPLWTVSSYDRSLLLALVYPLAAISLVWAIWGRVGQAEEVLLMQVLPAWVRCLAVVFVVGFVFGAVRFSQARSVRAKWVWGGLSLIFSIFAALFGIRVFLFVLILGPFCAFSFVLAAMIARFFVAAPTLSRFLTSIRQFSITGIGLIVILVAFIVSDPVSTAFGNVVGEIVGDSHKYLIAIIASGICVYVFVPASLIASHFVIVRSKFQMNLGKVIFLFSVFLYFVCAWIVPLSKGNNAAMTAVQYFFAVLTIVNAPFDWIAIGITRGLLRRGLERKGSWPLILALADFMLSLVLLALLALTTLWTTEIFNHALASGGGKSEIDVAKYLTALSDSGQRGNPEYYWLYAMLFSSQIPAVINMAFGALCLLRGLPYVNRWMAARLPETGGIGSWARLSVATAQSLQLALAVAIACIAYYVMVTFLIGLVDPIFGRGLVEILKAVRITPLFS